MTTWTDRLTWHELPLPVRQRVEAAVGSHVVDAVSQPGGFTGGTADRVRFADGARAFVKAIPEHRNPGAHRMHRREAAVMRTLPVAVPAAPFIAAFDLAVVPADGGRPAALYTGDAATEDAVLERWTGLILGDIQGRHPVALDATRVLDALAEMSAITPPAGLPSASDELAPDSFGWEHLVRDRALSTVPREHAPWVGDNLERLRATSLRMPAAVAGTALVHLDCRADNILIDTSGAARLVDWPWAGVGAPWVDALTYLVDLQRTEPSSDPLELLRHPVFAAASVDDVDALLSALGGMWFDRARTPPPAGLTHLREFQRVEAIAALELLRQRWA
ncbi:phosphotransferase [Microbacterium gorillae]|uniref:phosphotransferase n=1 Tax=Microbacterium gorillae TaxID=1231063 RepID=UPI00058EB8CE|nr:phosphotransferase [Microbacterium gorillae]